MGRFLGSGRASAGACSTAVRVTTGLLWTSHPDPDRRWTDSPKYLNYVAPFYQTTQPDWFDELTEAQQTVLEPAYIYNHPLLENDGETVDRESRTEPKQFSYQRQMAGRSS